MRDVMNRVRNVWKREEKKKIEYEAKSVRELLKEMKNISELIVDLSYSSILFKNKKLAREVRYLEARMDTLNYEIRMQATLAARNVENAEKMAGILQIAEAAESISNAAGDVVKILNLDLAHPLIPYFLKESSEILVRIRIKNAPVVYGKKLGELKIRSETGSKIVAIRRGDRWIYGPDKNETVRENDTIFIKGTEEGVEKVKNLMKGKTEVLQ